MGIIRSTILLYPSSLNSEHYLCKSQFNLRNEFRKMIFSLSVAVLCMGSAKATIQIAGYYADDPAQYYLGREWVQKQFDFILSADQPESFDYATCDDLALGKVFWDSSDPDEGAYLRSIPTYTGSESDEWGEYTSYYGSSDFHISWVNKAFEQGLNPKDNAGIAPTGSGRGKADFFAAFIEKKKFIGIFNTNTQGVWYPANKQCVGFKESIRKTTSYVYQFGEIMQLLQAAYDSVDAGCLGSKENPADVCLNAVQKWDGAVGIFVGDIEYRNTTPSMVLGVTLWSLAEKRCVNFASCGINFDSDLISDNSPVNYEVMRLFAAGRQATFQGEKDQMKVLQRLISNKLAIGGIQGTMRSAWLLSGQGVGQAPNNLALTRGVDAPGIGTTTARDKEVSRMGTYAMNALPKVWACSRNAEEILYREVAIGGPKTVTLDATDNSMRPSVNFDNVKLAFECNYKCLGITCEEVGSLFDGQTTSVDVNGNQNGTPLARSLTCKDGKMATLQPNVGCKRQRGAEKKVCRMFTKRPGVNRRNKLEFYYNSIGINT